MRRIALSLGLPFETVKRYRTGAVRNPRLMTVALLDGGLVLPTGENPLHTKRPDLWQTAGSARQWRARLNQADKLTNPNKYSIGKREFSSLIGNREFKCLPHESLIGNREFFNYSSDVFGTAPAYAVTHRLQDQHGRSRIAWTALTDLEAVRAALATTHKVFSNNPLPKP